MVKRFSAGLHVLFTLLLLLFCSASVAADRHALVIGNSDYRQSPLRNPVNDAEDMALALKGLGYQVYKNKAHLNVNREQMDDLLNGFTDQLPVDGVALFYFAGHGANDERQQSHLIPVGANIQRESQIKHRAIGLSYVAETLQDVNKSGLNILLIDACRDRPFGRGFSRSGSRGLSRPAYIPNGTFIGLAAGEGQVAVDGDGRNGVYTHHLLQALRTNSSDPIESVHKSIAEAVFKETASRAEPQRPVFQSDFFGNYCFGDCYRASELRRDDRGRLTVKVEPADARIRIMNISPAYEDGIELSTNQLYDVYVTREGYSPWRQQVELKQADQVVAVVLERRSVPITAESPPTPRRASYEPEMVMIKGGCFQMGSPEDEGGRHTDEQQHRVCVNDVYSAEKEVTVAQFKVFVDATGYRTQAERNVSFSGCYAELEAEWGWHQERSWQTPGFSQGSDMPVVCVSWNDALEYLKWLREETGKAYRLPTEAEWEYAARGGVSRARHWGTKPREACRYGNVADQSFKNVYSDWTNHICDDGVLYTAEVGSYMPNHYGLYDMLGNVWEWTCSEWDQLYRGKESNCAASAEGRRSLRGGSWYNGPDWVRVAGRGWNRADYRNDHMGFRVFQDIE